MRKFLLLLGWLGGPTWGWAQPTLDQISPAQSRLSVAQANAAGSTLEIPPRHENIFPSQTRLILAQASPASEAAVSSQAVATQPDIPRRTDQARPPQPATNKPTPALPPPPTAKTLDPMLDPNRPKNCQLSIAKEQVLQCGEIPVVLPVGTYQQKLIVENPEGRRAIGSTPLKPQQIGLGYIRYASDVPLKINGVERSGGLDVPIRQQDDLPVRVWYRKMTEPDDLTKAFTFLLPPVGVIAAAGAWSSGNVLLPDSPPEFTEARDYYLKPLKPKPDLKEIPQPSHIRPLNNPFASGSNQIRSK